MARYRLASADTINAARADDRLRRDFAFLDLPYDICGIEVRVMTVRDWLRLMVAQSPFITGQGEITPGSIASFLWALSQEYTEDSSLRSYWFQAANEVQWMTPRDFFALHVGQQKPTDLVQGIREYCNFIFFEQPASAEDKQKQPKSAVQIASFAAFVIHRFKEWGWNEVMNLPVPALFQLMRVDDKANGRPVFNKAVDTTKANFLRAINKLPPEKRPEIIAAFNRGEEVEI